VSEGVFSTVWINDQNLYLSASGGPIARSVVAGAIALLWSAKPGLKRDIEKTRQLIFDTCDAIPSMDCSSLLPVPNNLYGYGNVNIGAAFDGRTKVNLCFERVAKVCSQQTKKTKTKKTSSVIDERKCITDQATRRCTLPASAVPRQKYFDELFGLAGLVP